MTLNTFHWKSKEGSFFLFSNIDNMDFLPSLAFVPRKESSKYPGWTGYINDAAAARRMVFGDQQGVYCFRSENKFKSDHLQYAVYVKGHAGTMLLEEYKTMVEELERKAKESILASPGNQIDFQKPQYDMVYRKDEDTVVIIVMVHAFTAKAFPPPSHYVDQKGELVIAKGNLKTKYPFKGKGFFGKLEVRPFTCSVLRVGAFNRSSSLEGQEEYTDVYEAKVNFYAHFIMRKEDEGDKKVDESELTERAYEDAKTFLGN